MRNRGDGDEVGEGWWREGRKKIFRVQLEANGCLGNAKAEEC